MSTDAIKLIASLQSERHRLIRHVQAWDLTSSVAGLAHETRQSGSLPPSRSQAAIQISRIDAALRRYADGCFGHCCLCGNPINTSWLERDPATPLCEHCHSQSGAFFPK